MFWKNSILKLVSSSIISQIAKEKFQSFLWSISPIALSQEVDSKEILQMQSYILPSLILKIKTLKKFQQNGTLSQHYKVFLTNRSNSKWISLLRWKMFITSHCSWNKSKRTWICITTITKLSWFLSFRIFWKEWEINHHNFFQSCWQDQILLRKLWPFICLFVLFVSLSVVRGETNCIQYSKHTGFIAEILPFLKVSFGVSFVSLRDFGIKYFKR